MHFFFKEQNKTKHSALTFYIEIIIFRDKIKGKHFPFRLYELGLFGLVVFFYYSLYSFEISNYSGELFCICMKNAKTNYSLDMMKHSLFGVCLFISKHQNFILKVLKTSLDTFTWKDKVFFRYHSFQQ